MPIISSSVKLLDVGFRIKNLKRIKKEQKLNIDPIKMVAKRANFRANYNVVTLNTQPKVDEYVSKMISSAEYVESGDFAPWNPAYRKSKTLVIFR